MTIISILLGLIGLGIMVFVHELGHFVAAKANGVVVETFSLGWGPRLVGFKRGETVYQVSWFPIGGYCKMRGEITPGNSRRGWGTVGLPGGCAERSPARGLVQRGSTVAENRHFGGRPDLQPHLCSHHFFDNLPGRIQLSFLRQSNRACDRLLAAIIGRPASGNRGRLEDRGSNPGNRRAANPELPGHPRGSVGCPEQETGLQNRAR